MLSLARRAHSMSTTHDQSSLRILISRRFGLAKRDKVTLPGLTSCV